MRKADLHRLPKFSAAGVLSIELALVIPLLVLFFFAIGAFGIAFREQIKLVQALEAANRSADRLVGGQGVDLTGLCALIKNSVTDILNTNGINAADYTVDVTGLNLNDEAPIPTLSNCFKMGVPAFRVTVTRSSSGGVIDYLLSYAFRPTATAIVITGFKRIAAGSC